MSLMPPSPELDEELDEELDVDPDEEVVVPDVPLLVVPEVPLEDDAPASPEAPSSSPPQAKKKTESTHATMLSQVRIEPPIGSWTGLVITGSSVQAHRSSRRPPIPAGLHVKSTA